MLFRSNADVIVELIGGANGIAKQVVETALENGRHVVTARSEERRVGKEGRSRGSPEH